MGINSQYNSYNNFKISNLNNVDLQKSQRHIRFGNNPIQDDFQHNTPSKLFNELEIMKMISNNPEIVNILNQNNIPIRLNMKELEDLKNGHCAEIQKIAVGITKHLPKIISKDINIADLKDGALLHDFGKVLIPTSVLNKPNILTSEEHKIMNLHTELGYQLLKNSGINTNVLDLVRYHHCNYKDLDNGRILIPNASLQIINLADKYSALTEKRVYKPAFTDRQALKIINQEVQEGIVHPLLYNALVKYVEESKQT